MEVTGKNQDECIVALHDCNGDVNKAINILLEGDSDTVSTTPPHPPASGHIFSFTLDGSCGRGVGACYVLGILGNKPRAIHI